MDDRELLERAARAAGFTPCGWLDFTGLTDWHGADSGIEVEENGGPWNPLENDGDALRLMVTLGMEIKCYSNVIVVTTPDGLDEEELTGEELCKPDELAATRRAIVRAAAQMTTIEEYTQ